MRKVQYRIVDHADTKYRTIGVHRLYSTRYNRYLTIPHDYPSDGATCARDLDTDAWWFHDWVCDHALWDDGTRIDNWVASTILGDILWQDGFRKEALYWWFATYFFGGGRARKNGMRRVNNGIPEGNTQQNRIVRIE